MIVFSKSVLKERIIENISVSDFELSKEDMAAINTFDIKTSSFFGHRNPEMVIWLGNRNWKYNEWKPTKAEDIAIIQNAAKQYVSGIVGIP